MMPSRFSSQSASQSPVQSLALRRHSAAFCVLAAFCLAATPWLAPIGASSLLTGIAIVILILGVPHGALDIVFARALYHVGTPVQWLMFGAAYLVLAGMVVALWWFAPGCFMIGFLLLSAFHFSGDPLVDLHMGARLLCGAAVIMLPTMFHALQVATLFGYLIGAQAADAVVALLQMASSPLLVAELLLIAVVMRRDLLAGCEILCVTLLSLVATPLVAFAVFFCGLHGPRHFLRTAALTGRTLPTLFVTSALVPTAACLIVAALMIAIAPDLPADARIVRIVFVGLAALTVPHMVLVEQVRHRGWRFAVPSARGARN